MPIETTVLKDFVKKNPPEIHPGDVVRVHQKIREGKKERIQVLEGIVIAIHRKKSLDATFTVRRIVSGVGVERVFPLHSPDIVKIEFEKGSQVRRAKLYYLRGRAGKALRMKEKQIGKKVWEMVVPKEEKLPKGGEEKPKPAPVKKEKSEEKKDESPKEKPQDLSEK